MQEENEKNKDQSCCANPGSQDIPKGKKGILSGIFYGILPHTGCIAFVLFTILGATTMTALFRPLMINKYFFYILIALSLVFATISAAIYLKKHGMLSGQGMKKKWKYLSVMYGITVLVNLLMFLVIFPYAANFASAAQITGSVVADQSSNSILSLEVAIPCSGHASLITGDLKQINGVIDIKFSFPNRFDVSYDSSKTSQLEILNLEIFKEYPAKVVKANPDAAALQDSPAKTQTKTGSCGCGGCGSGSRSCGLQ